MAKIALAIGGAVAGAVVGFFFPPAGVATWEAIAGGALAGEAVGSVAGQVLFPGHYTQQGPRLSDLSISNSTDGTAIPFGYGTFRFGGNIIWSPGIVEHKSEETSGGKGGPSTTTSTYTYTCSFAVAFGEGTGNIKKIWGDSKIIYDSTASSKYPAPTLYTGTQTQSADPSIQGDKGAANTPAFRHLIYAVFDDFPLADFGNRIPNLRAEVQFDISELGDMVADICQRAGLDSSLYDVSLL